MKKYILFTILALLSMAASSVSAQTPTDSSRSSATTAPIDETEMKNVKKIIDLVASKSAEEKLASKIGTLGTVTQTTNASLTIQTISGSSRIIDIDEITKFSDPDSKSFGISDIKKGDLLGIIGILNKISNHVLARSVNKASLIPTYFEGIITDINSKNFQFTAVDENGNKEIVDITTSTKMSSVSIEDGKIKSGFTKVSLGQRIYAAGFPDLKVKGQLNATRFIHFVDLAPSVKMKKYVSATPMETSISTSPKPTESK